MEPAPELAPRIPGIDAGTTHARRLVVLELLGAPPDQAAVEVAGPGKSYAAPDAEWSG
jgi:hypothetical protein